MGRRQETGLGVMRGGAPGVCLGRKKGVVGALSILLFLSTQGTKGKGHDPQQSTPAAGGKLEPATPAPSPVPEYTPSFAEDGRPLPPTTVAWPVPSNTGSEAPDIYYGPFAKFLKGFRQTELNDTEPRTNIWSMEVSLVLEPPLRNADV